MDTSIARTIDLPSPANDRGADVPRDIAGLKAAFANGLDPAEHLRRVLARIAESGPRPVWISVLPEAEALAMLAAAQARRDAGAELPLFGIPFAVKDNIDVAGLATTAACPDFAFRPARHASVVERLVAAGAIPVGKTNLDQFATGLNGTRSPYGAPASVFDARYVSGGSSSGSAVAVASGLVPFALGTDTAGSGRVPAAFNNLVGLKPTKGLLSTAGVLPAARTLDCVTIFANDVADALAVAEIASGFDKADPYSRRAPAGALVPSEWAPGFRFGLPRPEQLDFFGDAEAARLFDEAVARLETLGGRKVVFDYASFAEASAMVYGGPWAAERLAAIRDFATTQADAMHPVVRDIILGSAAISAADTFAAQYRLAALVRAAEPVWREIDVMLLPTTGTIHSIAAMEADPVRLNSQFGTYTNFVNLMDLCATALPAGFRPNGLPFGISLVGPAFADGRIAALADRLHRALLGATMGGSAEPLPANPVASRPAPDTIGIAVVGAHLTGEPLNRELVERGGRLRQATRTAPGYALYALAGTVPAKPGLIRQAGAAGGIAVEIWDLPPSGFGSFVDNIPAPLGIGTLTLADGSSVKGFLCEPHALDGARDITGFGGWRAYRASLAMPSQPGLPARDLPDLMTTGDRP